MFSENCELSPSLNDIEMFFTFAPRLKEEDILLCPGSGPSKFLNNLPSVYTQYTDVVSVDIVL